MSVFEIPSPFLRIFDMRTLKNPTGLCVNPDGPPNVASTIALDESIAAHSPSLTLHLAGHQCGREPEEPADFEVVLEAGDVQLPGEEAKTHTKVSAR